MIDLGEHAEGVILPVRAQPNAKRSGIEGVLNGALKVAVTAPPEDGRANEALIEVLREQLGLKRWQVELLSGQSARAKRLLLRGVSREEVVRRLG